MSDLPDQVHQATIDTIERVRLQERERIIKLLENKNAALQDIETGHNAGSEINSIRTKTISSIIELIKGETNV